MILVGKNSFCVITGNDGIFPGCEAVGMTFDRIVSLAVVKRIHGMIVKGPEVRIGKRYRKTGYGAKSGQGSSWRKGIRISRDPVPCHGTHYEKEHPQNKSVQEGRTDAGLRKPALRLSDKPIRQKRISD